MQFEVFIASHLGSPERYQTIQWALDSIRGQTRLPDRVRIAYSYEHGEPDTDEWRRLLHPIPLELVPSRRKVSQFTHYYRLFEMVRGQHETVLMFLDDDDLLSPDKVAVVAGTFEQRPELMYVLHRACYFGSRFAPTKHTDLGLTPPNIMHRRLGFELRLKEYCMYSWRATHLEHIEVCSTHPYMTVHDRRNSTHDLYFAVGIPSRGGGCNIDDVLLYIRNDSLKKDYRVT
jgi:hypothetical protein